MDVKYAAPFLAAFQNVLPQIGFQIINQGEVIIKGKNLRTDGILIIVGLVGDLKGNVVYSMSMDDAKKIASKMMMGMPVDEFGEMAQSALSELANMLTANASTEFSKENVSMSISTPTLMYGKDITTKLSTENILCAEVGLDDGISVEINISIE
ncbi:MULTISPECIES: chemotaxis protein CheX [Tepidanaerobacter]|uniref:Chemotaxis protein CheX n=1 Tax=Tepidanaerobacter syntrophicus TaxID=224999 RepID=A0A0U9HKZ0_9FIRM|nr:MULTISPECIES: chemotaxis protein CheX [Tepidanaerobacter]GAQ24979.1 chemotaxis protein CheX [Tepidanaerobacter syntrophicus]GLI19729.1 chemotaxis protein CheX [Tepidanaerobacter syntrophicus]GLI51426.1 chemotaxis protein CheX [Tepidanaerobacter syntrophicus]HHV84119.1 chemotaxis protein CheX [Tepidanaerobacter syntrophicus]